MFESVGWPTSINIEDIKYRFNKLLLLKKTLKQNSDHFNSPAIINRILAQGSEIILWFSFLVPFFSPSSWVRITLAKSCWVFALLHRQFGILVLWKYVLSILIMPTCEMRALPLPNGRVSVSRMGPNLGSCWVIKKYIQKVSLSRECLSFTIFVVHWPI